MCRNALLNPRLQIAGLNPFVFVQIILGAESTIVNLIYEVRYRSHRE